MNSELSTMADLKFDLEHTRQWAIAAENDLVTMKARALYAEAQVKDLQAVGLQTKVDEMTKLIEKLYDDVEYWHKSHLDIAAELEDAKEKINEANVIIEELVRERDALYASLN